MARANDVEKRGRRKEVNAREGGREGEEEKKISKASPTAEGRPTYYMSVLRL